MTAANGHEWEGRAAVLQLQEEMRTNSEAISEVRSGLVQIEHVRGSLITTQAALSHLGTDVRQSAGATLFLRGRVAEFGAQLAAFGEKLEVVASNQNALERLFTDFVAEWRRAQ